MVPSLALGTGEVTLLELTAAYSAFANKGVVVSPRLITRVEDSSGKMVWLAEDGRRQAISATTAYLMSSMLSDVVSSGTAARARTAGFTLPAAGKTGTTDDYSDAWFIGYTPHLLTGVWFGLDTPAPIMSEGFGGTVAVPAWARFMRAATKGAKPDWYRMPSDVEKVAVCRLTGLRAGAGCREGALGPAVAHARGPLMDGTYPPDAPIATVARPVSDEPAVYEDLFPVGAMPSDTCQEHDPARVATTTPLVDAALQPASHSEPPRPPGAAIRTSSRLFIERVPRADGSHGVVFRQRN
jgi:membrane peptidoglycan carboxypeptidase